MNFSLLNLLVAMAPPLALAILIGRAGRPQLSLTCQAASWLGGMLIFVPVSRAGLGLESAASGLASNWLVQAFLTETLATGVSEELGKGLVMALVLWRARHQHRPSAWIGIGVAAHLGFATLENIMAALGNESLLRLAVGRALTSVWHASFGAIMGYYGFRLWHLGGNRLKNIGIALGIPILIHGLANAALTDLPEIHPGSSGGMSWAEVVLPVAYFSLWFATVGWAANLARRSRAESPIDDINKNHCTNPVPILAQPELGSQTKPTS